MNLKLFKIAYLHFSNPYSRSIMVAFTAFFLTLGITYLFWYNDQNRLIILAGLPISFLVLLTILSFSQTAEQARTLARKMSSEIRHLNAELKKKDTMLIMQSRHTTMGEMISMIAHQWRQPLASISTISGTLNMQIMLGQYDQNLFTEKLNLISDIAVDLSDTMNDFRNFFKEDKTKQLTTWKELIEGSLDIIKPMLIAKNIHISLTYGKNNAFMTYPHEITQVILNILKNAEDVLIENSIEHPQIWIRTSCQNGQASLEIEDNGGGIPPELIDRVFDPYFSTKFDTDGTGIGLYISKTIIEQHGNGTLTVINTDHGACFNIQLPIENHIDSDNDLSTVEKLEDL